MGSIYVDPSERWLFSFCVSLCNRALFLTVLIVATGKALSGTTTETDAFIRCLEPGCFYLNLRIMCFMYLYLSAFICVRYFTHVYSF